VRATAKQLVDKTKLPQQIFGKRLVHGGLARL
jgi:hypothetical protein